MKLEFERPVLYASVQVLRMILEYVCGITRKNPPWLSHVCGDSRGGFFVKRV